MVVMPMMMAMAWIVGNADFVVAFVFGKAFWIWNRDNLRGGQLRRIIKYLRSVKSQLPNYLAY